jgi:hypothetical protein
MGAKWLRVLEFTQGVSVPDESTGDSELRIFLETLFASTNSQNFRLEQAFENIRMPKKALTIENMQLYAAEFAAELGDQLHKLADPNDRVVQEVIIGYFYKGLHPDYLREKISHFKVSTIKEAFNVFREYCTPIMVEAANFSFLDVRRRRETPLIRTLTRESKSISSESPRAAKKAGSLQSEITKNPSPALSGDLPVFDCDNCGGTHKSMNCKSDCRLCKSKGLDSNHVQFHCPKIVNAVERKQSQLPRPVPGSTTRSVKSAASKSKKPAGSVISAITQEDDSFAEEDSEVRHDYPV